MISAGYGWTCRQDDNGNVAVWPIEDLVDHEPYGCVCGPTPQPVRRDDGSTGWVVTHHALDGRP